MKEAVIITKYILLIVLSPLWIVSGTYADTYNYEFDVDPDDPSLGAAQMIDYDNRGGYGMLAEGDFPPTGDAGRVGHAGVFIDSSDVYGTGFYITQIRAEYTMDMRVRCRKDTLDAGPSMGMSSLYEYPPGTTVNVGRGIQFRLNRLALMKGGGPADGGTATVDLSDFRKLRFVIKLEDLGDGFLHPYAYVYDLEEKLGGVWPLLMGPVRLGATGYSPLINDGGGIHLNALSGSTVKQNDHLLDWIRIAAGVDQPANPATDDPISGITPTCVSGVLPQADKSSVGPPADPSQFVYEVFNTGSAGINYTVTEVDHLGAPTDHTWLSLDKTSGAVPAYIMDTVTTTIDMSGQATGDYTAYLKFSDDCTSANIHTRKIEISVAPIAVLPTHGITVHECLENIDYAFTLTNHGGGDLDYTVQEVIEAGGAVTDYPWMSVTPTTGTISVGQSEAIIVTIDSNLISSDETGYLKFIHDATGKNVIRYVDVKAFTAQVIEYNGNVEPDSADAGGMGVNFTLEQGTKQGTVVDDVDTLDGKSYHVGQTATGVNMIMRSSPSAQISEKLGATLVARIKMVRNWNTGGVLFINDKPLDNGNSVRVVYGGPGPSQNDKLKENDRTITTTQLGKVKTAYHIIRVAAGWGLHGKRTVNVYVDEELIPSLTIPEAEAKTRAWGDSFGFGTHSSGSDNEADYYLDWLTATDAGVFAPCQEYNCLGRSLCIGGETWGCLDCRKCNNPFADADNDGDVDQDDFAVFQLCYTGSATPVPSIPEYCVCFDRGDDNNDGEPDLDNDIDEYDFTVFQNCASGPNVPADLECDD